MSRRTKPEITVEISGLLKVFDDFPDVLDIGFARGKRSRDELEAPLRRYLAAVEQTRKASVAHRARVAEERRAHKEAHPIALRLRQWLRARLNDDSAELVAYGVKPTRPTKKTVAVKVRAIEKSRETRKLRRTMGKKQRKAIKG